MSYDPWYERLRAGQAERAASVPAAEPAGWPRITRDVPADPGYVSPHVTTRPGVAPGPHGDVPVRVYLAADTSEDPSRPLFVWCHGGGWVEGDLDMPEADATSREVCARTGGVVVSVDYRLATEGVFYPVPVDDVLAAWTWALETCSSWGASPRRAVLGGASAGGNIATGAALRLRDQGMPMPHALILVYPAQHAVLPVLTDDQRAELGLDEAGEHHRRQALTRLLENYQGAPASEATPYVAPALGDLRGLPPTLIITCQYDLLRVSGEDFARRLDKADVQHKLVTASGVGHGHLNSPWLAPAQETYGDMAAWIASV